MATTKRKRYGAEEIIGKLREAEVGLAQGLELILSSRTLSGEKAYRAGLCEAVLTAAQFDAQALAWVLVESFHAASVPQIEVWRPELKRGLRSAGETGLVAVASTLAGLPQDMDRNRVEHLPLGRPSLGAAYLLKNRATFARNILPSQ